MKENETHKPSVTATKIPTPNRLSSPPKVVYTEAFGKVIPEKNLRNEIQINFQNYLEKLNYSNTRDIAFKELKFMISKYNSGEYINIFLPALLSHNSQIFSLIGKEFQILLIGYAISVGSLNKLDKSSIQKMIEAVGHFLKENAFSIHKACSISMIEMYDMLKSRENSTMAIETLVYPYIQMIEKNHSSNVAKKENSMVIGCSIICSDLISHIIEQSKSSNMLEDIQFDLMKIFSKVFVLFNRITLDNPYLFEAIFHIFENVSSEAVENSIVNNLLHIIFPILNSNSSSLYLTKIQCCNIIMCIGKKILLKQGSLSQIKSLHDVIASLEYSSKDRVAKVQIAANEALYIWREIQTQEGSGNNEKEKNCNTTSQKLSEPARLSKLNLLRNLSKINKEKRTNLSPDEVKSEIYSVGIGSLLKTNSFLYNRENSEMNNIRKFQLRSSKEKNENQQKSDFLKTIRYSGKKRRDKENEEIKVYFKDRTICTSNKENELVKTSMDNISITKEKSPLSKISSTSSKDSKKTIREENNQIMGVLQDLPKSPSEANNKTTYQKAVSIEHEMNNDEIVGEKAEDNCIQSPESSKKKKESKKSLQSAEKVASPNVTSFNHQVNNDDITGESQEKREDLGPSSECPSKRENSQNSLVNCNLANKSKLQKAFSIKHQKIRQDDDIAGEGEKIKGNCDIEQPPEECLIIKKESQNSVIKSNKSQSSRKSPAIQLKTRNDEITGENKLIEGEDNSSLQPEYSNNKKDSLSNSQQLDEKGLVGNIEFQINDKSVQDKPKITFGIEEDAEGLQALPEMTNIQDDKSSNLIIPSNEKEIPAKEIFIPQPSKNDPQLQKELIPPTNIIQGLPDIVTSMHTLSGFASNNLSKILNDSINKMFDQFERNVNARLDQINSKILKTKEKIVQHFQTNIPKQEKNIEEILNMSISTENMNKYFEDSNRKFEEFSTKKQIECNQLENQKYNTTVNPYSKTSEDSPLLQTQKVLSTCEDRTEVVNPSPILYYWESIIKDLDNSNLEKAYETALDCNDDILFLRLLFLTGPCLEFLNSCLSKRVLNHINKIYRCYMIPNMIAKVFSQSIELKLFGLLSESEQNEIMETIYELSLIENSVGKKCLQLYEAIRNKGIS